MTVVHKRVLTVLVTVVAFLGVGAAVYASIPGPDGVIHGCRKTSDGSARIIDSAASCPSGFTAINWNQTGPQGPTGAAGANGVSGYEVVNVQSVWTSDALNNDATALCPAGKVVVGGGGVAGGQENANFDSRFAALIRSIPAFNGTTYVGWTVAAHRDYTSTEVSSLTAYAICANVGS